MKQTERLTDAGANPACSTISASRCVYDGADIDSTATERLRGESSRQKTLGLGDYPVEEAT